MVSDRLRDIIFKKLYNDLSHIEIIEYTDEIWFIDREEKFWYFIYNKSGGEMWWRHSFFTPLFSLFSLPHDDIIFILSSWVEDVLNCKVSTSTARLDNLKESVEEVLNCKVITSGSCKELLYNWVEEVLNCEVTTSNPSL